MLIGEGTARRLASMDGLKLAAQVTPRGLTQEQPVYTFVMIQRTEASAAAMRASPPGNCGCRLVAGLGDVGAFATPQCHRSAARAHDNFAVLHEDAEDAIAWTREQSRAAYSEQTER